MCRAALPNSAVLDQGGSATLRRSPAALAPGCGPGGPTRHGAPGNRQRPTCPRSNRQHREATADVAVLADSPPVSWQWPSAPGESPGEVAIDPAPF